MPLIIWNKSIEIDINKIDNQHRKLVQIINDLYDAMNEGKSNEVLDETINKLVDYTDYHFATEEQYFKEFDYSESDVHKKEHSNFSQKVREYQKILIDGKTDIDDNKLTADLWRLLQNWLVTHINNSDKKYKPLFKSHGL